MTENVVGEARNIEHSIAVERAECEVSALLRLPGETHGLLVLGPGAGAGMRHAFMEDLSSALAATGLGTLRYQFPYMERGRRAPDRPHILQATVRAAVSAARKLAPELPLLAGGKSMGGRMTSLAASREALEGVRGLIFFGFPLHAAGKPGRERGEHLAAVGLPMLFFQGTRDRLADLELLRPLCQELGTATTLHIIDDGDHSFRVPKRAGRSHEEIIHELAMAAASWAAGIAADGTA